MLLKILLPLVEQLPEAHKESELVSRLVNDINLYKNKLKRSDDRI